MKLNFEKNILLNGIQIVQNVITPKSTLPILSNILVETLSNHIRLTATDLDIGITCLIPVNIQEPGSITIPAKRFYDIVKELTSNNINFNTKKNNLILIETEFCQFKIMGLSHEEFPKLPEFKDKEAIKINQGVLKKMLGLTSFVVSFDETRYVLNGILFKIEKNNLTLVATDGKRLALAEKKLQHEYDKTINIIIPIKTIQELSRNLKDDGELSLTLGDNQILFDLGDIVIISRLIEGEFPDWRQVIPPVSEYKINISRGDFLLAVKRASLLATPDYQAVKLEVFKDKIVISKTTPDIGESREELKAEYHGKEMVMGFNPTYLMDVLKNLSEEKIAFELTDTDKPGVIRVDGYIYLVLPMRLG